MADDTRLPEHARENLSKEALTVDPTAKPFSGAQWAGAKENETYSPPANANTMAGGTQHTAGGAVPEVSISAAFNGALKTSDFTDLPKKPCVRDSLLMGMGAGFALGGLRLVFRAPISKACNLAVGSFCVGAGVNYQVCMYRRQREKEGMQRAVEILNRKEMEKKAREGQRERAREERRRVKEQEQEEQFRALSGQKKAEGDGGSGGGWGSWKFW